VQVVGLAYFVITGCGNPSTPGPCANSDGKWVNGTFVGVDSTNPANSTGPYNPTTNNITTQEITQ
jgi:hypothetical protein